MERRQRLKQPDGRVALGFAGRKFRFACMSLDFQPVRVGDNFNSIPTGVSDTNYRPREPLFRTKRSRLEECWILDWFGRLKPFVFQPIS